MAEQERMLTWTLKMPESQLQTWEDLQTELSSALGRATVGRSKLSKKELVETLVELARTDDVVRARLVDALRG